jgi:acetolactate synthase I/II/III large subunit
MPLALGAAIACPDRKVVLVQADGSGMYTVQAMWSMAREKADVIVIVLSNDAYAILNLEMARVRDGEMNAKMKSMLNLNNPELDWVNIATGLGVPASRAATAEEFHERFKAAVGVKGPQLIECRVATPKEWHALEELIRRTR